MGKLRTWVPLYSASCFIHTRSQLPEDNKQPPSTHVLRRVKTFSTPLWPVAGCAGSGRSRAAVFHQRVTIQEPTESRLTPFVVEHKVAVQSRPTADRSHSIRRERPPTHRPPAALHGRRLVSISVHRPWITGSTCYLLTYLLPELLRFHNSQPLWNIWKQRIFRRQRKSKHSTVYTCEWTSVSCNYVSQGHVLTRTYLHRLQRSFFH